MKLPHADVMRLSLYVCVFLFMLPSLGQADHCVLSQSDTATFHGSITDTKGKRLRGAHVSVEGTNFKRAIKPNRKGEFQIELPPGIYKIKVKKSGFATFELLEVRMTPGRNESHVFQLECSCPTYGP